MKTTKTMTRRNLKLLLFLFFSLCLVMGCKDDNCMQLTRANALTEAGENDSALHVLSAMNHQSLSEYEQAVYNLIKVKALYWSCIVAWHDIVFI